jgi:cell division protein FtsW (lipid II flippase)
MALCTPTETQTELGCLPNDPVQFIAKFYSIGLGLIGGVGILFIIYGGYLIITSQGNPLKLQQGQGYVKYAIIGILLAIFGYVLVQVIIGDVLQIPGFG